MSLRYKSCQIIIMIIIIFSCASCKIQDTDGQKKSEALTGDYPYANSTDIFSVENDGLFSYDGNGNNKTNLRAAFAENCLLNVTDEWLYYKKEIARSEFSEKEIEAVYRIPLKKGDGGRSIIAGEDEKITDNLSGVTVAAISDDYLVYIRSAACVNFNNNLAGINSSQEKDEIFSVNIKTGEIRQCNMPAEMSMRDISSYKIIGNANNKIVWAGDSLFYLDLRKNEIAVVYKKETTGAAYNPLRDEIYYCKKARGQEIMKYDIKKGQNSVAVEKKDILLLAANCLGVSSNEIKSFSIEDNYYYCDGKIYLTIKTKSEGNYQRYILTSYSTNEHTLFYEPDLDNIKHLYSLWNEYSETMMLVGCVEGKWFFWGENGLLKYDSGTGTKMLCDTENSGNEIYAIATKKRKREGGYTVFE